MRCENEHLRVRVPSSSAERSIKIEFVWNTRRGAKRAQVSISTCDMYASIDQGWFPAKIDTVEWAEVRSSPFVGEPDLCHRGLLALEYNNQSTEEGRRKKEDCSVSSPSSSQNGECMLTLSRSTSGCLSYGNTILSPRPFSSLLLSSFSLLLLASHSLRPLHVPCIWHLASG